MVGKGLRRAVELDDDKVFDNFMKDPELAIEYEILVAGSGGHEDGLVVWKTNNYYCKSGDWGEKEINPETMKIDTRQDDENDKVPIPSHVKVSASKGKYHDGIFKKEDSMITILETRLRSSKIFTSMTPVKRPVTSSTRF